MLGSVGIDDLHSRSAFTVWILVLIFGIGQGERWGDPRRAADMAVRLCESHHRFQQRKVGRMRSIQFVAILAGLRVRI
jgi:hypothetical protein